MDRCYSLWMDQCYSSMLQLNFIQKVKENTSLRHEGMPTQKMQREERPLAQFWFFFLYVFFFLPLGLPCVNWASQECCLFYPRSSLGALRPFFVLFLRAFPFLIIQPPPFWTPFSYSNYLTFSPQEMGGSVLWEQGHRSLSGYFLLNWDGKGHWASPSCQSQASESLQRCPPKGERYFLWSVLVLYILVELALHVVAC